MIGDVVEFRPPQDDYFGVCPKCRRNDGCLNIGPKHWYYCDRHRVKWSVGENLFSSWRHEDEEIWRQNELKLSTYRTIDGYWHPRFVETGWAQ